MTEERVLLDPNGPDDEVVTDQTIVYEESESDDPTAETALESVQDVRP
jgi:hypothetical protein